MHTLNHRAPLLILLLCSEFVKVAEFMSQCRGQTRFQRFKKGIARNDMIKEIQKCDRQMSRMFDRFMVNILFRSTHNLV